MFAQSKQYIHNKIMEPEFFEKLEQERKQLLVQSNASEVDVIKQVVLINTGALAVTGALVTTSTGLVTLAQQVLVTTAIALLVISIANAILFLTLSHFLFLKAHNFMHDLVKTTKLIEVSKQPAYYTEQSLKMKVTINKIPFVLAIMALFISVLLLSVVILINVW